MCNLYIHVQHVHVHVPCQPRARGSVMRRASGCRRVAPPRLLEGKRGAPLVRLVATVVLQRLAHAPAQRRGVGVPARQLQLPVARRGRRAVAAPGRRSVDAHDNVVARGVVRHEGAKGLARGAKVDKVSQLLALEAASIRVVADEALEPRLHQAVLVLGRRQHLCLALGLKLDVVPHETEVAPHVAAAAHRLAAQPQRDVHRRQRCEQMLEVVAAELLRRGGAAARLVHALEALLERLERAAPLGEELVPHRAQHRLLLGLLGHERVRVRRRHIGTRGRLDEVALLQGAVVDSLQVCHAARREEQPVEARLPRPSGLHRCERSADGVERLDVVGDEVLEHVHGEGVVDAAAAPLDERLGQQPPAQAERLLDRHRLLRRRRSPLPLPRAAAAAAATAAAAARRCAGGGRLERDAAREGGLPVRVREWQEDLDLLVGRWRLKEAPRALRGAEVRKGLGEEVDEQPALVDALLARVLNQPPLVQLARRALPLQRAQHVRT
mmetsp:Transcript_38198/g.117354  ORF Transcript_38198/g.117354 Transcript_38198/m.117354 type:complete len:497 (+) Transcript_38198:32-1522(+)